MTMYDTSQAAPANPSGVGAWNFLEPPAEEDVLPGVVGRDRLRDPIAHLGDVGGESSILHCGQPPSGVVGGQMWRGSLSAFAVGLLLKAL